MFKFHPNQKTMSYHKYQHIYVWIVYGLVNFGQLLNTIIYNFIIIRGFIWNI